MRKLVGDDFPLAFDANNGYSTSGAIRVGRALEDIELPGGTTIVALVRGDDVIIAHHDTVIREHDHVLLFVSDKAQIPAVESLFQVSAIFV